MAQIKVGSNLKTPKDIHVFKEGLWIKSKSGRVFYDNSWIEFTKSELLIYTDGYENTPITVNHTSGGQAQKLNTHISLRIQPSATTWSHAELETEYTIDLSGNSKVFIEWEVLQVFDNSGVDSRLEIVDTSNRTVARKTVSRTHFNKRVDSLDISSLSGSFFIRVIATITDSGFENRTNVYRIWAE